MSTSFTPGNKPAVGHNPKKSATQSSAGMARFLSTDTHSDPYAPGIVKAYKRAKNLDEVVAMASQHFDHLAVATNTELVGIGAIFDED